jgi:hypothetical protein
LRDLRRGSDTGCNIPVDGECPAGPGKFSASTAAVIAFNIPVRKRTEGGTK